MPPHPASHYKKWNGSCELSDQSLLAKPELAGLVASVIAAWSMTEAHLGRTLAALIGSKQPVIMSMYSATRSFEVQRALLLAAVKEVMPKRYADIFDISLAVLARSAKYRHRFAHCIWGRSLDTTLDALVLVAPKDSWNVAADQLKFWRRAKLPSNGSIMHLYAQTPNLSHDKIIVYRLKDLQEVHVEVERSYQIADALFRLAGSKGDGRRRIYNWLIGQADIRSARDRAKNDSRPKAPPPAQQHSRSRRGK
jgi:hypothetical protein